MLRESKEFKFLVEGEQVFGTPVGSFIPIKKDKKIYLKSLDKLSELIEFPMNSDGSSMIKIYGWEGEAALGNMLCVSLDSLYNISLHCAVVKTQHKTEEKIIIPYEKKTITTLGDMDRWRLKGDLTEVNSKVDVQFSFHGPFACLYLQLAQNYVIVLDLTDPRKLVHEGLFGRPFHVSFLSKNYLVKELGDRNSVGLLHLRTKAWSPLMPLILDEKGCEQECTYDSKREISPSGKYIFVLNKTLCIYQFDSSNWLTCKAIPLYWRDFSRGNVGYCQWTVNDDLLVSERSRLSLFKFKSHSKIWEEEIIFSSDSAEGFFIQDKVFPMKIKNKDYFLFSGSGKDGKKISRIFSSPVYENEGETAIYDALNCIPRELIWIIYSYASGVLLFDPKRTNITTIQYDRYVEICGMVNNFVAIRDFNEVYLINVENQLEKIPLIKGVDDSYRMIKIYSWGEEGNFLCLTLRRGSFLRESKRYEDIYVKLTSYCLRENGVLEYHPKYVHFKTNCFDQINCLSMIFSPHGSQALLYVPMYQTSAESRLTLLYNRYLINLDNPNSLVSTELGLAKEKNKNFFLSPCSLVYDMDSMESDNTIRFELYNFSSGEKNSATFVVDQKHCINGMNMSKNGDFMAAFEPQCSYSNNSEFKGMAHLFIYKISSTYWPVCSLKQLYALPANCMVYPDMVKWTDNDELLFSYYKIERNGFFSEKMIFGAAMIYFSNKKWEMTVISEIEDKFALSYNPGEFKFNNFFQLVVDNKNYILLTTKEESHFVLLPRQHGDARGVSNAKGNLFHFPEKKLSYGKSLIEELVIKEIERVDGKIKIHILLRTSEKKEEKQSGFMATLFSNASPKKVPAQTTGDFLAIQLVALKTLLIKLQTKNRNEGYVELAQSVLTDLKIKYSREEIFSCDIRAKLESLDVEARPRQQQLEIC